jgi:hypothetical protein
VVSEREQREYARMRERVRLLRSGARDIGPTVNDLSALVWELQETPEEWRERFIEAWSGLEISYAVALDRRAPLPTAADHDIAEDLDELDSLLNEVESSG